MLACRPTPALRGSAGWIILRRGTPWSALHTARPRLCADPRDGHRATPARQPPAADERRIFGYRRENFNLPNALTMLRIAAAPVIGAYIVQGEYSGAAAAFFVAGACDWLDGFLARRWNQQTLLGSILDPFADKVLIGTIAVSSAYSGLLSPWWVGLVVARDASLVAAGLTLRYLTKPEGVRFFDTSPSKMFSVVPSLLSKLNTAGQMGVITAALCCAAAGAACQPFLDVAQLAVGGTTALTFADYFARAKEVTVMPKQSGDPPGVGPQAPPDPASRTEHEHRAPPRDGNGPAG